MHSAAPTPAEHHYSEAEQGLSQLALLGLDEPERLVETLVALVHATLAIAAAFRTRSEGHQP